jgi:enoyl-CoA hydratase
VPIRLEVDSTVAVITIDEPATRNALDAATGPALVTALREVAANPAVSALVLRGAGGHFCAGADRALLARAKKAPHDPEVIATLETIYDSFVLVSTMPVPVIAAVRGAAVGAGVNLALAADVRIASRDARLLSGFLRIGVHPGGGHFTLLERLAGPQTTVAMTLLGEEAKGERLAQLGLAWEVLDDALVEPRALELAARLGDVILTREAMATFRAQSQSRQLPLATALRAEQIAQFKSFARAGAAGE